MRVIQFSDSFLPVMDGVGNVVYQYATNMGQKGQEVYVVCPQTDTGYRGNYPFEIVDYLGVPLLRLKSYKVGTPLLDVHCLNRLNHIHPDIIHVHSPFIAGHAGLSYAHRAGCPIVGTFHSKYYDDFLQVTGNRLMAGWGAKLVANLYEKFTEVWTVSASSADTLRGYGYKGDIRVISNGTDIKPVTDADVDAVRARFGLDDTPLLLYVGQINWKKNLRCVLEGCARLKRPFRLLLAGQGPHERDVARLAEDLGIGDKVLFTGHICDGVTLNAYCGSDAIRPYLPFLRGEEPKTVSLLLHSANRSSGEVQDLISGDRVVHTAVADLAMRWSTDLFGRNGYSQILAVVGAQNGPALEQLRRKYDRLFYVVSGYGMSGNNAKNASYAFDRLGHGAIVSGGSAITGAWRQSEGEDYLAAARLAAERMRKNILNYITVL